MRKLIDGAVVFFAILATVTMIGEINRLYEKTNIEPPNQPLARPALNDNPDSPANELELKNQSPFVMELIKKKLSTGKFVTVGDLDNFKQQERNLEIIKAQQNAIK
jgi:hypothetical protein